ncbi:MAG: serine--tRNA ligase [Buchnera aphidicola (Periphyllus lyropictus)]|uniref:serine--tRNA ligase n=1 Tax=Buchnera aphidicola TaxID=9 RepID=UPI001EB94774|nr:serine--tRNA ligase [Buchnera aphidicola]NIH16821.1 serine--tRNA ligase [Buchnera aphidicola (Periphyllus lyropictus)]USS94503.1 serine--tRNA ligase [Buchnera aphidicola (Periphyllus lyropictus)]
MINPKLLRKCTKKISKELLKKGFVFNINKFKKLENKRKKIQIKSEKLRFYQKKISKMFSKTKTLLEKNNLKIKGIKLSKKIQKYNSILKKIQKKLLNFYLSIPNILLNDVPIGNNKSFNKIIYCWGKIKKMDFKIKDHVELGNNIDGFDWKNSAKISGANFVVMKKEIAKLYRILSQFMLDLHIINHNYIEIYVPYIVHKDSLYGTGQLPKFNSDLFYVNSEKNRNENNHYLIPTAEVPLTNLVKNTLLQEKNLPYMFVSNTPCFRSESTSYGKNFKGLIRLHQFDKVELVQIVHPKNSFQALENITFHAEKVLKLLKLPYRKVLLCSEETNFSSAKTYDLEVWFPSQKSYKEISSCSNMLDFQSRRIKSRYFDYKKNKNCYVHTLNGSALAVGRTLAALLENYQQSDGSIKVPKILSKKYMNGLKFIK